MGQILRAGVIGLIFMFGQGTAFGQQVDWVRNGGGTSFDEGYDIATDQKGNSYITGQVYAGSTYYPRFSNDTLSGNGYEMFFVKYNRQGQKQFAFSIGGSGTDVGTSIDIKDTSIAICGMYQSSNAMFKSVSLPAPSGGYRLMVAKTDTFGNPTWVRTYSIGNAYFYSLYKPTVAFDNQGNIYATGYFNGSATFDTYTLTASSGTDWDIYVVKISASGSVIWAKSGGSSGFDYATGLDIDNSGNVYLVANFTGLSFTLGTMSVTKPSTARKFVVAKLNSAGVTQWMKIDSSTTTGFTDAYGLSIDKFNQLFVTGSYFGGIVLNPISKGQYSGSYDIFVAKFDTNGVCRWISTAGGTSYDQAYGLETDDRGNIGITGRFYNNATFGTTTHYALGYYGIFYSLLDSTGAFIWSQKAGGGSYDQGNDIALDSFKNIYATGQFTAIAAFGDKYITSNGQRDVFVVKITDCSSLDSAEITYTGPTTICRGDSVTIKGNKNQRLSLKWLYNSQILPFETDSNLKVGANGTYRLAVDDEGCLDTSDAITINVITPVTPTISSFPSSCIGDPDFTLTQGLPSGGIYKGIGVKNDTVFSPSTSGIGTFLITYVLTDTNGCSDSAFRAISVGGQAAFLTPFTSTYCDNDAPFTLSGGFPSGGSYIGTGVSSGVFYPSVAGAGTHPISYVFTNLGCSDTATQNITINSKPSVSFASVPMQCASTFSLNLASYVSPSGGTFSGTGVIASTFYPIISGSGTFSISYRVANGGCADTAFRSIQVDPVLSASISSISARCI
ncbi:MAG: SBBP repeat-containing protein, partial [Flavobacteriales bacterium]|nr:SBBP repeat-containing protein [Flavobacteriales bacterium]